MSSACFVQLVPPTLSIFASTLTTITIFNTGPADLLSRSTAFAVILLLSYDCFKTWPLFTSNPFLGILVGPVPAFQNACLALAHLLLQGTTASDLASKPTWSFVDALTLLQSCRGIGFRFQIKHVPSFPTILGPRPGRFRFLLLSSLIALWEYMIVDIFSCMAGLQTLEQKHHIFAPGAEWLLPWQSSREQLRGRIMGTMIMRFVIVRVWSDLMYRIMAVMFVSCGLTEARDWPPFHGSLSHAYTLRGYWGRSWHQTFRYSFTSISNFVTRSVLRLPRPSAIERYTNTLLVFFISGLMHLLIDVAHDIPVQVSEQVLFYTSMAFGIMIEDAAQAIWRHAPSSASKRDNNMSPPDSKAGRISGRSGVKAVSHPLPAHQNEGRQHPSRLVDRSPLWAKIAGFVWVSCFLCMTSPMATYPRVRYDMHRGRSLDMLPYSFCSLGNFRMVVACFGLYTIFLGCALGCGV